MVDVPAGDAVLVLRALSRATRSRAELAEETGWSRNTVSSRLDALLDSGWVVESAEEQGGRGRPFVRYELNPQIALVYVASFGWDQVNGALCTVQGRVVASETLEFQVFDEYQATDFERIVDFTRTQAERLAAQAGVPASRIGVTVVGVPNPVANSTQLPSWTQIERSPGEFAARLGMPVIIENDVNLMALGARRTDFPEAESLIYVKCASGIGAGIVLSGKLHRGINGLAGEIGHVPVARAQSRPCVCGNKGCLVEVAGVPAILQELQTSKPELQRPTLSDLERMVLAGDPAATSLLRRAGREIGEALVGVVTGLAPDVLVVSGAIANFGDHLITGVRESIVSKSLPRLSSGLRIEKRTRHRLAAVNGAAELAVDALFPTP